MRGGIRYTTTIYAAVIATIRETERAGKCRVGRLRGFGRVVGPRGSEARGEETRGRV